MSKERHIHPTVARVFAVLESFPAVCADDVPLWEILRDCWHEGEDTQVTLGDLRTMVRWVQEVDGFPRFEREQKPETEAA